MLSTSTESSEEPMNILKILQQTAIMLTYADKIFESTDVLPQKLYENIQVKYEIIGNNYKYFIPVHGDHCLKFCLMNDALEAEFIVDNQLVMSYKNIRKNTWYDFLDFPINMYSILNGKRVLHVFYKNTLNSDPIQVIYIKCTDKIREQSVNLVYDVSQDENM